MTKVLLVTPTTLTCPPGGRALLAQLHRRCLQRLFGADLLIHELRAEPGGTVSRLQQLAGFIDGVTPQLERQLVARICTDGIDKVYLDGSNLGRLARAVKRASPGTEVLTFFHNVEARFFLGSLRKQKSAHALGVMIANYRAERAAVRSSDRVITLSERDGRGLARLYGRGATDILPMGMDDKLPAGGAPQGVAAKDDYLLFVGGAFYANLDGIRWFARHVAPHINIETRVVGRGMDAIRDDVERGGKVRVIGPVDRLDSWYGNARAVIAPIFDGSGMKTKVAEALMFGKRVVGTPEAFSGYEAVADQAGWTCGDADEFIAVIRSVQNMELKRFDPLLRALYERGHSFEASLRRLSAILGRDGQVRRNSTL